VQRDRIPRHLAHEVPAKPDRPPRRAPGARARSLTIERRKLTSIPTKQPLKSTHRQHVCCLEIRGSHVRAAHSSRALDAPRPPGELGANTLHSYNRYLTVAARVVRRSLKDDKRLAAERRGESDLRFAKWEVRIPG
jgi:hypothetical protein